MFSSIFYRGRRTRTPDIWFWRPTFYQLNYAPICEDSQNSSAAFAATRFLYAFKTSYRVFYQMIAFWSSPQTISNSQLHTLLHFHLCPIYLVFFKGLYPRRVGYLISGWASRLDAFSVYPFRTWLPGYAIGMTAGAPAVRPARSSRTKASSPQISYARAG